MPLSPIAVVQIGFDPLDYPVAEDSGQVSLRIRKFTTASLPVTVFFSTEDGTATGQYI